MLAAENVDHTLMDSLNDYERGEFNDKLTDLSNQITSFRILVERNQQFALVRKA